MKALYETDKETLKTLAEILYAEASLIVGLNLDNNLETADKIFELLSK
jgi:hypothetical protein